MYLYTIVGVICKKWIADNIPSNVKPEMLSQAWAEHINDGIFIKDLHLLISNDKQYYMPQQYEPLLCQNLLNF